VELVVARGKFINGLKVLNGADLDAAEGAEELTGDDFASLAPTAPDGDEPNASWGYSKSTAAPRRAAPPPLARPPAQAQPAPVGRSREQLRATAALAAATFAAGKRELSAAEDIVSIAEYLYAWIVSQQEGGA
jgi:hypothetical protein